MPAVEGGGSDRLRCFVLAEVLLLRRQLAGGGGRLLEVIRDEGRLRGALPPRCGQQDAARMAAS